MYSVIIDTTGFPLNYGVYYYDAETKEEKGKEFLTYDQMTEKDYSEAKNICLIGVGEFTMEIARKIMNKNPDVQVKVVES